MDDVRAQQALDIPFHEIDRMYVGNLSISTRLDIYRNPSQTITELTFLRNKGIAKKEGEFIQRTMTDPVRVMKV